MATPEFSLVLLGRLIGRDRIVGQALARAFSRDDNWGLQIVGASPITILTGLNQAQAQAVHFALAEVERLGSQFQVQPGVDGGYAQIQWPEPPRVLGKLVSDYGTAPAAGAAAAGASTTNAIITVNVNGQPVRLQLQIQVTVLGAPTGQTGIGVPLPTVGALPASGTLPAAQPPMQIQVPQQISAPVQLPAPIPIPIPKGTGNIPVPVPMPGTPGKQTSLTPRGITPPRPAPLSAPQPVVEPLPIEGLDEIATAEEVAENTPAFTPAVEPARPPASRRSTSAQTAQSSAPLPEVPVVGGVDPLPAPIMIKGPGRQAERPLAGPMALEDFEAGLNLPNKRPEPVSLPSRPQSAANPVPSSATGVVEAEPRMPNESASNLQRAIAEDPDALCSIFIGRSTSAKVHALVAEIQGVTVEEAQKLCQKPVVSIVKDIPVSEAQTIKQRFVELNITPRVMVKR